MRKTALIVTLLVLTLLALPVWAQRREIRIPDIYGYTTLKCDFHMHTVFSDGLVWPTVRVDEAWREGLDAISITDHIEYQPHKADVPTNHNRPYEIAAGKAAGLGLLLIRGTEITRNTPPGHFNAIFLNDINPLDTKDFFDVLEAAKAQKAFVFWNHPGWKAKPGEKYIADINEQIREKGLIQGVEVVNGRSHYADAHTWALNHNFTLMGNSDIHSPADNDQMQPENHRTMTLVFAREKTVEAIKEALLKGRTAVYFGNTIIGKGDFLEGIFEASIHVQKPYVQSKNAVSVLVTNESDIDFELRRTGKVGPSTITFPAGQSTFVKIPIDKDGKAELAYTVTNLCTAPGKGLSLSTTFYAD
ncbi:MAG: hypothetical protein JXA82_15410 [Sedimentisphaerales bacterium]|nr:hypothetical protein [Sedimentisphaerales bacterium]